MCQAWIPGWFAGLQPKILAETSRNSSETHFRIAARMLLHELTGERIMMRLIALSSLSVVFHGRPLILLSRSVISRPIEFDDGVMHGCLGP